MEIIKKFSERYLLMFMLVLTLIFFMTSQIEKYKSYDDIYIPIIGKVTKREIDGLNTTSAKNKVYGINIFSYQMKYRIKVNYVYLVNGNKYENVYYTDYIENLDKIKKIWRKYKKYNDIVIYYNKYNFNDSNVYLDKFINKNINFYYVCCFISFIIMLLVLYFTKY